MVPQEWDAGSVYRGGGLKGVLRAGRSGRKQERLEVTRNNIQKAQGPRETAVAGPQHSIAQHGR